MSAGRWESIKDLEHVWRYHFMRLNETNGFTCQKLIQSLNITHLRDAVAIVATEAKRSGRSTRSKQLVSTAT
jgi:hypothetical protein